MSDAYPRGVAALAAGDAEAAVPLLEEAARLEPARARVHANLATALDQVGRTDDALAAAARGVELRGDDVYPLLAAARIAWWADRRDDAERYAAAAWDARATIDADVAGEMAEILAQATCERDEWRAALAIADLALARAPDRPMLHAARAISLAIGHRFGEAARALDAALALDPDDDDLRDRRASLESALGQVRVLRDEARAATVATTPAPTWQAWHALGALEWACGEGAAAAAAFDRARALHPDDRYRAAGSSSMLSSDEADVRIWQATRPR